MKKKIFRGIAVLIVVAIATFGLKITSIQGQVSNIALSNVEALATGPIWEVCFEGYTPPGEECSDECDQYLECTYFGQETLIRHCADCSLYFAICVYCPSSCTNNNQ
ncbi:MAG: NVEALA domain-containing protein [Dysgonamonadaceae bacterium]|jgi:hypothetical protein|nr:NVEALA domain-containing protein [Dysgonamonadaceae bacterium]